MHKLRKEMNKKKKKIKIKRRSRNKKKEKKSTHASLTCMQPQEQHAHHNILQSNQYSLWAHSWHAAAAPHTAVRHNNSQSICSSWVKIF